MFATCDMKICLLCFFFLSCLLLTSFDDPWLLYSNTWDSKDFIPIHPLGTQLFVCFPLNQLLTTNGQLCSPCSYGSYSIFIILVVLLLRFSWFLIYPLGVEGSRTASSSIIYTMDFSTDIVMFVFFCTSPNMWFPFWHTLLPQALKQFIPTQSGDFTLESGESSFFNVWNWDLFCLWVSLYVSTLQILSAVVLPCH